ncbi:ATP synthase subunit I [Teredinibacter sp. KSP-S5-2]|uniref:ATP synthase subunit I n=1 Tax=Teredinibacter sp. KSP-S5-2 TaxID=3034506 RepID=UPI002934A2BE|nr:ATP synthase subunit I [Teredinibacter sp. KSP-S5-2]WNO09118.1 ATP synthase subunit I [Teredinibacter sp. KSP-S5-2]
MVKAPISTTLIFQLGLTVPVSTLVYWFDPVQGYSFLLGALIYLVPNLYFTNYAFRYSGAKAARWVAGSFSLGESGKLALAAVGFAAVLKYVQPLDAKLLFAGFICLVVLQWFIAMRISRQLDETNKE